MVASMVITSITNWLTPTILFCILNLMIAIIFIVSNFKSPSHHHHHHDHPPSQLVRSPSLLERVKSVNFSSFYYSHDNNNMIDYNNLVSQLARPPSFLQRVRSIDLSFSSFYTPPVDLQVQSHELHDSPSQFTRVPSLIERVKSFKLPSAFNSFQSDELTELTRDDSPSQLSRVPSLIERVNSFKIPSPFNSFQSHELTELTRRDSPSQLSRVPSFLERVKSFKLSSPFNSDNHHSGAGEHSVSDMDRDPLHDFDHSETSDVAPAKKPPATDFLTKSRSEKRWPESDEEEEEDVDRRRPATMKAAIGGGKDECVDAKADDFIKRFKQQLKLQRLDSLQRFREMLNRGTTSASA